MAVVPGVLLYHVHQRMPRVWHEHACSDLSVQLHITRHAADDLLGLAHDLTVKLPGTAAVLRDGIIDAEKAHTIALRCSVLTPDEARAAEAILFALPDVDEMTWSMIRDRIGRAVIEVNPEAAVRRRKQAARQRRVEVVPEDSGNAMIAGRELPPTAVLAASQMLPARACQLRQKDCFMQRTAPTRGPTQRLGDHHRLGRHPGNRSNPPAEASPLIARQCPCRPPSFKLCRANFHPAAAQEADHLSVCLADRSPRHASRF